MNKTRSTALLALIVVLAACTSTPQFQSGPDAEVTHDGLTRLDKTVMDTAWARRDIDLSAYSKIILDPVGIEYRPVKGAYSGRAGKSSSSRISSSRSEFQLDDATKAKFAQEIGTAFAEEMARSSMYTIVDQPGPDVLTVRAGLLDVVSRVPPEPLGSSEIFIDRVGDATLVLELRDSMSGAIFARAVDRRAAESGVGELTPSNSVRNAVEVRRLGRKWAGLVRKGLETLISKD